MIAAVVVTHSPPPGMLARCVDALVATPELGAIVVVDNGGVTSTGGFDDDRVSVLRTDNTGYGAAVNAGVASIAAADVVAVLNDDVEVQPGWLAPLVEALAEPDVGAAQPVLVAPGGEVVVSAGVGIDRYGAGSDIDDGANPPVGLPRQIEIFNGGTVLFRRAFLAAAGGFDERFFMYYEDVDLARRGRAAGWRYVLVPASQVVHRRSSTAGSDDERMRFLQERNRLWVTFEWASPSTIARALWLSVRRLRHRPIRVHARALRAGLGGAPTRLTARWRRSRRGGPTRSNR